VIETSISPAHGAVANLTGLRHPGLHMVRISSALVILQMAGHTGCIGEVVIAVDMALRAGRSGVRPCKRKPGVGMVETGVGPRVRVVASCTGSRDARRFVVWIGRAVVILHVARGAVCIGQIEVSVNVAL